ncbi:MAG: hypothetical protein PVI40_02705 [Chlamydiota bacterium]|jgi:hypothetical protein
MGLVVSLFSSSEFHSILNNYKKALSNSAITFMQVQEIADHLGEIIQQGAQNHYTEDILQVLSQIELLEESRRKKDHELLLHFQNASLELKQLELNLDVLLLSEIEESIKNMHFRINSLQKSTPYQNDFFQKEIEKLKSRLEDLQQVFQLRYLA